jgi:hypothetical protein
MPSFKSTRKNLELLLDYDPFNRIFCKHFWRTGANETAFPIYDPKSIIRINQWNEITYEYKLTHIVYEYLKSTQSEYRVFVNEIKEDDFCLEFIDINHPPECKSGLKPLLLEILSDQLILKVYEYKTIAMPYNCFQLAIRYKDEYFYFIDIKNCPNYEKYIVLKETIDLKLVNHNGSLRNTNAIFDLRYPPIPESIVRQSGEYVGPVADRVIFDGNSYCSDNTIQVNQTTTQGNDDMNNFNNNNNNSSDNRKRKGISEENLSTRDIIDNSFMSKVHRRNFNAHDNYDGINQIREGYDFDDVILICYDRSNRSTNETQRDLSFGLMFVKRENDYFDIAHQICNGQGMLVQTFDVENRNKFYIKRRDNAAFLRPVRRIPIIIGCHNIDIETEYSNYNFATCSSCVGFQTCDGGYTSDGYGGGIFNGFSGGQITE